jgi:hypothetical protein
MATASRDWMFCPQSGYLLKLDSQQGRAYCEKSGYSKRLSGAGRAAGCLGWRRLPARETRAPKWRPGAPPLAPHSRGTRCRLASQIWRRSSW